MVQLDEKRENIRVGIVIVVKRIAQYRREETSWSKTIIKRPTKPDQVAGAGRGFPASAPAIVASADAVDTSIVPDARGRNLRGKRLRRRRAIVGETRPSRTRVKAKGYRTLIGGQRREPSAIRIERPGQAKGGKSLKGKKKGKRKRGKRERERDKNKETKGKRRTRETRQEKKGLGGKLLANSWVMSLEVQARGSPRDERWIHRQVPLCVKSSGQKLSTKKINASRWHGISVNAWLSRAVLAWGKCNEPTLSASS